MTECLRPGYHGQAESHADSEESDPEIDLRVTTHELGGKTAEPAPPSTSQRVPMKSAESSL